MMTIRVLVRGLSLQSRKAISEGETSVQSQRNKAEKIVEKENIKLYVNAGGKQWSKNSNCCYHD